jgi:hypothetical protein
MFAVIGPSACNACWMALCRREAWAFERALRDPLAEQTRVLRQILAANHDSWFGIQHRFASLETARDFQNATPLSTYDDYCGSIERIGAGERRVLTTEAVNMLEPTGGSTTGEKLIPYTAGLRRGFQRAIRAWIWDLFSSRPPARRGAAYWSISPIGPVNRRTAGGVPIGFDDDAAYLSTVERRLVRRTMAVPPEVAQCPTVASCLYATLFFLLRERRLSLISVWSPTFLSQILTELWRQREKLCDDIAAGRISFEENHTKAPLSGWRVKPQPQQAAALRKIFSQADDISQCIREIWPHLALVSCWADGPSATYAEHLRSQLNGIELQPKGLLATEAVVSIPLASHGAGALAIRSHFFEFLPAPPADAQPVLAHELELGSRYRVVVTTQGGLYRYQMNDEIEVVGRHHATPLIRFVGKTDATSDLVGEKLNAAQVEAAMKAGCHALGLTPHFAQLMAERNPPGYVLRLCDQALQSDVALSSRLCHLMQESLALNPAYRYAIELGQLAPLRVESIGREEADRCVERYLSSRLAAGQRWGDVKMPSLSAPR